MVIDRARLVGLARNEFGGGELRSVAASGITSWMPTDTCLRLRRVVFRLLGFRIGEGTVLLGDLSVTGGPGAHRRLAIGCHGVINEGVRIEAAAPVVIGDHVALGQDVRIITNAHRVGCADRRHGMVEARPVVVHDGAWLSTRCTILPGVTIGAGAVVAAGAVVRVDVAPNTMVGGVPARPIARLDHDGARLTPETGGS